MIASSPSAGLVGLANKRVFVTGAANGCGAGVVRALVASGARVVASDIADTDAEALAEELGVGEQLSYHHLDVADRDAVFQTVNAAAAQMGGIDALVNAAGIVISGKPEDATIAHWDRMFDIHVKGTLNTNQAVFPHLRDAGGGAIVNFGSIAGVRGMKGFAVYGSAKGAVLSWTRNAALEWGEHGVRVNAVAPAMESKMTVEARASRTPEELEMLTAATRAATAIRGELGDPTLDLAPLIALLVSDGGSYITGQVISVDGGMMMLGS